MTQSETAEGSLAESSFRLLFEAAPNAMIVADEARNIAFVTRGVEQLFGYRREELIGRDVELLISERFGTERELFGRRKDGREGAIEVALSSLETAGGLFTLTSIVDITARRHSEDEKRRCHEDLEQFVYVA